MDREQFMELMLTDQKIFSHYAKLFMASTSTKAEGFLDWCWEKYRGEIQPNFVFRRLRIDFFSAHMDT